MERRALAAGTIAGCCGHRDLLALPFSKVLYQRSKILIYLLAREGEEGGLDSDSDVQLEVKYLLRVTNVRYQNK